MSVEFEIKKVPMETLGEYLQEVRKQLDLTLEEVSKQTGIYQKFIHNIEQGKYNQLPPDVYVRGFLKKLAEAYSISSNILLEQYQKERGVVESAAREKISPSKSWKNWIEKLTITPKLITIAALVAVGAVGSTYVLFQIFAINKTPSLEVFEPRNDTVVSGSKVTVSGKTEVGMSVTINNQNILVNKDGSFTAEVGMVPGQKDLVIESQNKLGKKNSKLIAVRVEQPRVLSATVSDDQNKEPIRLELKFAREAKIEVNRDGIQLPQEIVPAGAVKNIVAEEEIILETSDAGSISATLNSVPLGLLGKQNEALRVPFNREMAEATSLSNSSTAIGSNQSPTGSQKTN